VSCNDIEKSRSFWYSGFQNLRVEIARVFSKTLAEGGRSKLEFRSTVSCNDLEKSLAFWYSRFQNLRVEIARVFSKTLAEGGRSKLEISIYRVLQRS